MSAATTHAWLRRVSDYHSGSVSATERAAVEAHLAECAECRLALAAYRRLYTLARSPLRLGDGGAGALTEYRPMMLEETMTTTDTDTRRAPPWRRPPTRLTALGAIAAVPVIAILAAALFARFRSPTQPVTPRPTPTATPALDPQSQAYVTLLRTYYLPVVSANHLVADCFTNAEGTRRLQDVIDCRSPVAEELARAQTARIQLATASPPARWQSQHTALLRAIDGLIALLTEQETAIDAQDVTRFLNTGALVIDRLQAFCPIVSQLNAGPPPLSPRISPPDSSLC
jgi:hypothetical protein